MDLGGWILLSLAVLPIAIGWVTGTLRSRRLRRRVDLDLRLDHADFLGFLGRHDEMPPAIEVVERDVRTARGADAAMARARCHVLRADVAAAIGHTAEARARLEGALSELEDARQAAGATELEVRAAASLALLVVADAPDDALLRHGDRAFEQAGRVCRRDTLVRLAEMCRWLGQVSHRRGRWPRSREFYEAAVRVAERHAGPTLLMSDEVRAREWVYWSHARAAGSAAAIELGLVLYSLGERGEGVAWLDRAVTLPEQGPTSLAQYALSRALMARAAAESDEPMLQQDLKRGLFERAVVAGLRSGWPAGRVAASEAEFGLALLGQSIGVEEEAVRHLRQALVHLHGLEDDEVAVHAQRPLLILARVLEGRGDVEGAIEQHRHALARGREAGNGEARRYAAVSAYHLQRLLASSERMREAAEIVGILEELVPTCEPGARTLLSALAAHAAATQASRDRPEEAVPLLERAEALARQAGTSEGWDFAREMSFELGRHALQAKQPAQALVHLQRALSTPPGSQAPAREQADRAGIWLHHAHASMALDREPDALNGLRRAADEGRASGQPLGREVAAVASMLIAQHFVETLDERRRLLETARNLGRLSGRPRGREIAAAVAVQLRELAE